MAKRKKDEFEIDVPNVIKSMTPLQLHDSAAEKLYPTLVDLLTSRWKDGKMTWEGGTLTLVPSGGGYRVTLRLPSAARQTTLAVDSLTTYLATLENELANGQAVWEMTWDAKKKAGQGIRKLLDS